MTQRTRNRDRSRRLAYESLEDRRYLSGDPTLPLAAARPANGVKEVYALIVSTAEPMFSLPAMTDFYNILTDRHGTPADHITFLVVNDAIPAGYESMIDGIATKSAFASALADLGSRADADDILLANIEADGTGYLGYHADNNNCAASHGFLFHAPQVNQSGDGDEFDFSESNFEWSLYCGAGTKTPPPFADFHAGLGEWVYTWYHDSSVSRRMYASHYSGFVVTGMGAISDNDDDIDLFTDYALGDTNQDGRIDTTAGESWDYDGDGIPCYNRGGPLDEDEWGPIDGIANDVQYFHSPLGIPYHVFDQGLDNKTDVDINPVAGGPYEVDGTDLDNDGCIDGIDLNDDGDMSDAVAVDETIGLIGGEISDDEVAAVFNGIQCGAKVFITNTCYGGGFINDLSGPNTIVMSGSLETSQALAGWFPKLLNDALSSYSAQADVDGNGEVSLREAFNFAAQHPHYAPDTCGFDWFLCDDNGDGVGSRGPLISGSEGDFAATIALPAPAQLTISGTLWSDLTANAVKSYNEPALVGWQVYLDSNNNSRWDEGEPQTLTAQDGTYRFANLPPGDYTVRETLPAGWTTTSPANAAYSVSSSSGTVAAERNFCNRATSSLSGTVWNDCDGDGVRDPGEPAAYGCPIIYWDQDQNGALNNEWLTWAAVSGSYFLDGLEPGNYTLRTSLQGAVAGWQATYPASGAHETTLGMNQSAAGGDFGIISPFRDTPGVYDPATSTFFLRYFSDWGNPNVEIKFGMPDAEPIAGDWNGDGTDSVGIFQRSAAHFYLRNSNASGIADVDFGYGVPGSNQILLMGDWNGDGVETIGLYLPDASFFELRNSNSEGMADMAFGFGAPGAGWMPLVGDWDGDGDDTVGLYDPQTGMFYLRNSHTTGIATWAFPFGEPGGGWTPLIGDWDGNGSDSAGFYQPGDASHFYLRYSLTIGMSDVDFGLGFAGCLPIVGNWDGRSDCLPPRTQALPSATLNDAVEARMAAAEELSFPPLNDASSPGSGYCYQQKLLSDRRIDAPVPSALNAVAVDRAVTLLVTESDAAIETDLTVCCIDPSAALTVRFRGWRAAFPLALGGGGFP